MNLIPIHGSAPVPGNSQPVFPAAEALTHDWNKYRDTIVATGGVDSIIRTFDLRNTKGGAIATLQGHKYAVRKLAWSPHLSDVLLSASYDMTTRLWTDGTSMGVGMGNTPSHPAQIGRNSVHTEFATGVDWCLFGAEGWCATTAWDERVLVFDVRTMMGPNNRMD